MKEKKMWIIDVVIVIIAICIFAVLRLSGIFAILITIAIVVFVHCFISFKFLKEEPEEPKVDFIYEVNKLREQFSEVNDFLNVLQREMGKFLKGQKALEKLIILNDKEKSSYLKERNEEAEQFLQLKLNQLKRYLVLLDAVDKDSEEYSKATSDIKGILEDVEEMCDAYGSLLYEVSKMKDSFNIKDPGLVNATKKLKAIRERKEGADSEDVGLFVTKGE